MTTSINRLDPLAFPLHGSRLIEASAGTGKTFTLAMLYLRLILRHGQELGFTRSLLPPEILVVTFTNAATDELRDRIRRRLVEAAAVFRGQLADGETDALLLRLRTEMAEQDPDKDRDQNLTKCARFLDLAAEWMDMSAISTIHAWCYRMLREHAFESGYSFDQQLAEGEADLLQQATEDYWRAYFIALPIDALRQVRGYWADPSALKKAVKKLIKFTNCIPGAEAPQQSLRRCEDEKIRCLSTLKSSWREGGFIGQLEGLFQQAVKAKAFNQRSLNSGHRGKVFDGLREWLETSALVWPEIFGGQSWRRMSSQAIGEIWLKPDEAPAEHPACQALACLQDALNALPDPYRDLLAHAIHWIKDRVEREKQRRGELTQHDLLVRLDQALQSTRGKDLAAAIRKQFPVALVDEFQDTDPLQYRIFNMIYQVKESNPATGFFMIGDPKQAIYAFRGADIHTYLIARSETLGRHYTLDTNYRSTPSLIDAVNKMFDSGEEEADRGAFLFRNGEENPVPFVAVKPGEAAQGTLSLDGERCPALQAWLIEGEVTKERYGDVMAQAAAREIAHLLALGQQGRALLPAESGVGVRSLRPSDLAVLVNDRGEAKLIRDHLRRLGVANVYLSERNSVFNTAIARELLILLRAIGTPTDERLLRQALAIRSLGRSLGELDRFNHDELYWEAQVDLFRAYHVIWRRQGVLPLLYRVMADFTVAARLMGDHKGERDLTDLLHLGELLQTVSQQLDGEQALVRYLDERIQETDEASEAQQLRLESDEQLVKVVTIHKSKGLEYPLVFLPFILNCRSVKPTDLPLKTHDDDRRLLVHLRSDESIVQQADQERLGEDLRKLYVALTRARFASWLGIALTPNLQRSALGYLLGLDGSDLAARLGHLKCLTIKEPPEVDPPVYRSQIDCSLDTARPAPTMRSLRWWIASYTSLKGGVQIPSTLDMDVEFTPPLHSVETAQQETALEETALVDDSLGTVFTIKPQRDSHLHAFPRGTRQGTFLHGILEWAADQRARDDRGQSLRGYAAAACSRKLRLEMLGQRCNLRGLTAWIEPLDAWLADFLVRPWVLDGLLDADGQPPTLALRNLAPHQIQVEMEFWLESRAVQTQALDRLVQTHCLAGHSRPGICANRLNGMLKGFIDLVFEHAGRYYVADWKSNWLGSNDAAYTPEAMREAILHARYDLQYVLYLLALHRQLQARLPGYDYDRHVGGAVYVFLRGGYSASQGLFMDKPPRILIEMLDRLFTGETTAGREMV